jgi:hypothetical protein
MNNNNKGIYIVNCKETTIDENGALHVDVSTCDEAYLDEKDAINQCWKLSDDKFNDLMDEDGNGVFRDSNYDWVCVNRNGDTYEYYVSKVYVKGI